MNNGYIYIMVDWNYDILEVPETKTIELNLKQSNFLTNVKKENFRGIISIIKNNIIISIFNHLWCLNN